MSDELKIGDPYGTGGVALSRSKSGVVQVSVASERGGSSYPLSGAEMLLLAEWLVEGSGANAEAWAAFCAARVRVIHK